MNIRRKVKEIVYDKLTLRSRSFPYFGVKVHFPKGCHLFYRACKEGVYEHTAIGILNQLIKENTFFFDVGANIGLISIPILKYNPSCNCVAFEPSPNTLPYLKLTASESKLANRWKVIGKAIGSSPGELDFHLTSADLGAFDGLKSTGRVSVKKTVKVPVTTIDLMWTALGCPVVSVIKIDVEGAEADVFAGAIECIAKCKPYIYLEWNLTNLSAYGTSPGCLLKIAEKIDYGIYVTPNIVKINSEDELLVHMLFSENFLLCPI
jgi:FkbM family methyltransferase